MIAGGAVEAKLLKLIRFDHFCPKDHEQIALKLMFSLIIEKYASL